MPDTINIELFQHQYIRDLAWLLASPALGHCTSERWQIPAVDMDTLAFIDQELIKTHPWDNPNQASIPSQSSHSVCKPDLPFSTVPKRLGYYVESLWQFLFQQLPDTELLACNKVIYQNKRTLGELDIILHDKRDNQVWHLELAIKFYLKTLTGWGEQTQWTHWLGPGCIDSLDHKWHKLLLQQLRFSQKSDIREALKPQGLLPDKVSSLTRGILFYPGQTDCPCETQAMTADKSRPASAKPRLISPEHQTGEWLCFSHWQAIYPSDSGWLILKKPFWLALPAKPLWQEKRVLEAELSTAMQKQHPVLLAGADQQQRLFIVPDDWPQRQPLPWHYGRDQERLDTI